MMTIIQMYWAVKLHTVILIYNRTYWEMLGSVRSYGDQLPPLHVCIFVSFCVYPNMDLDSCNQKAIPHKAIQGIRTAQKHEIRQAKRSRFRVQGKRHLGWSQDDASTSWCIMLLKGDYAMKIILIYILYIYIILLILCNIYTCAVYIYK